MYVLIKKIRFSFRMQIIAFVPFLLCMFLSPWVGVLMLNFPVVWQIVGVGMMGYVCFILGSIIPLSFSSGRLGMIRMASIGYNFLTLLVFTIIAIGYYAWAIYPNIPHEFGGPNRGVPISKSIHPRYQQICRIQ